MATIMTHGAAAVVIIKTLIPTKFKLRYWFYICIAAMLPDLDVIGFKLGIPYGSPWGHRGITHSIFFALIASLLIVLSLKFIVKLTSPKASINFCSFFIATVSHGFFDAVTDGGLGVAFFAPFNNKRYFLPWTPVHVSPIGIKGFISPEGWAILKSEFLLIMLPLLGILLLFRLVKKL